MRREMPRRVTTAVRDRHAHDDTDADQTGKDVRSTGHLKDVNCVAVLSAGGSSYRTCTSTAVHLLHRHPQKNEEDERDRFCIGSSREKKERTGDSETKGRLRAIQPDFPFVVVPGAKRNRSGSANTKACE